MADAGYFRGTSSDQDGRFSDKEKKLMKQMKFEENLNKPVDVSKVNLDVIKPWITLRVNEILGMEDDVVIEYIISQLEIKNLNPKLMQINITGFLNARYARMFMGELWGLLAEANESEDGIPKSLVNKKLEEMKQEQDKNGTQNTQVTKMAQNDWQNRYQNLSCGRFSGSTKEKEIRDDRVIVRDRSPRRRRSPPPNRSPPRRRPERPVEDDKEREAESKRREIERNKRREEEKDRERKKDDDRTRRRDDGRDRRRGDDDRTRRRGEGDRVRRRDDDRDRKRRRRSVSKSPPRRFTEENRRRRRNSDDSDDSVAEKKKKRKSRHSSDDDESPERKEKSTKKHKKEKKRKERKRTPTPSSSSGSSSSASDTE